MFTYPNLQVAPILIIDDMPSNIRVMREAVKDLGEVFFATNILRSLGCHILQGYYFSRPLPLVDMGKVLRNGLPIAQ